ncbi:Cytochrome b [hydrothermal vent metagenome]|uniref:Cytochrome b n=1 Tax=hydrothermal vent metagenome TaxID=652676 RepID=A0A3B0XFR0_9ZZZZ
MKAETRVWDIFVRLFHWGLVIAFSVAYLSGEEESMLHIYSGYAVLGLISFRILWGFIGSRYARFSNFVHGTNRVNQYLKSLLTDHPEHYKGHNPAGGWMVIALLISLFVTTLSGLKLYAVEEGLGPFADSAPQVQLISSAYADDHSKAGDDDEDFWEEFWEEIHEAAANFTLLLIFIHIAGVFVSSFVHKENLLKAMISGNKKDKSNP